VNKPTSWKWAAANLFYAATAVVAPAQTFTTLTSFSGANGSSPFAPLVQGTDGNFYGTTDGGGTQGFGTIFRLTPAGALTRLYSFCIQSNCADGELPYAGLVQGTDGNFYGTTIGGGSQLFGTVFKITSGGALTTLYSFCQASGCTDGSLPSAGLIQGAGGNFYGTTAGGGSQGFGTIFQITPAGALTTLYNFSFSDANPSGLIQGADGNFYGATSQGGTGNFCPLVGGCGTIFQITAAGALTPLYSFCGQPGCADGEEPSAGLVQGTDGNFYGTTSYGGASNSCQISGGCGTVFKMTPAGAMTTLYSFCGQPGCTDGANANAALVQGTDGNYYGTATLGGSNNTGTIFQITPAGALTTLYNFCSQNNCADGGYPYAGLVQGLNGTFYGTTSQFGANGTAGDGTVFSLSVGLVSPTISGQVTLSGSGLTGVTMTLSGSQSGSTATNGSGSYNFAVQADGNYTVTPSLSGYTFSPPSQTFNGLGGNQVANFSASPVVTNYTISGQVTLSGSGLSGVTMTLSGSQSGSTATNGSGSYNFSVQADGNYTVTPSLSGYTFSPPSQTFNGLGGNQVANFSASPVVTSYTISGQVTLSGSGLSGVTMTLSGSQNGSTTTNGSGSYSFTVAGGGNYTVTASPSGYTFSPPSQTFNGLGGNQVANFNAGQVTSSGLLFISMPPCRVVDTRDSTKPSGFGPPSLAGEATRSFAIPSGACGIPAAAQAYSLNVTVVPDGELGYLTVWPTGQSQPVASTLNSLDGEVKANAAIVPAGGGGAINVFATDDTDVVLDINGYFVLNTDSSGLAFYPMPPCRLVDTRPNPPFPSIITGALTGGTSTTLPILSSSCHVPATAQAYSLNFTLVPPGPVGYLTVYPTGDSLPLVSTLNDPTGTVEANAAIAPAGADGSIDVYVTDTTNLVVDINGYFAPVAAGALSLYSLPPCRVLDTRNPPGAPPFTGTIDVNVIGSGCGGTSAAQAYVFNATVVPEGPLGYLTLWPQGSAQPLVSTLNAMDGEITSNMAIVPTTNAEISAFASNNTYLILDIFGYFAP
jgi:uncharacterized repeat protein (TIGR03803 family)